MLFLPSQTSRYVLLFEGRTGSSYLTTSLDAHPQIHAMEEELRQFKTEGHAAQARWVRDALKTPLLGRFKSRGFKTKLRDIADPQSFGKLLESLDARIIFMQRRNRIKAVVSQIRSRMLKERTNLYNAYSKDDRLGPVEIPKQLFEELLKGREQLDNELNTFVDSLNLQRLDVFYEDILEDESGLMQRLNDFLGVSQRQTRGTSYKNTSDDLRESVTNLDDLMADHLGTPYEAMFTEVLVK